MVLPGKEYEGPLQSPGNALYLDLGDGYTIVHICENTSSCMLKICVIYCM